MCLPFYGRRHKIVKLIGQIVHLVSHIVNVSESRARNTERDDDQRDDHYGKIRKRFTGFAFSPHNVDDGDDRFFEGNKKYEFKKKRRT
jgi:hypothetical protein